MQVILGANGIIGTGLAKALTGYTDKIRLVSRQPKQTVPGAELVSADLLDAAQTDAAVKNASIVYLAAGLVYNVKVWQQQWPVVMQNVIAAAKNNGCKLVFFDNIYMYGRVNGEMTEATPFRQDSKKGVVRGQVANMLLQEIQAGKLTGMICRAPEFYGPGNTQSGVNALVFDNLKKGKSPKWLVDDNRLRTFIYTPDAANATALLANSPGTWNQTWHLPCADGYISGKEFMGLVSASMGTEVKYSVMPKWMVKLGGLFNPYAKEIVELLYQYDQDYCFNSDKFKKAFPAFEITSYAAGTGNIVKEFAL
jgi:nucleoside-diphosphate-sugar epimerase